MTEPSDTPQDRVTDAKDRAVDAARDATDKVAQSAKRAADTATGAAETAANRQIDNAAEGLQATAHRLREVAQEVDDKDAWLQSLLNRAAGGLDSAGDYLSGDKLGSLVGDAQRAARENPAAFIGGAAALGFVLARLGKATLEQVDENRLRRKVGIGASAAPHGADTSAHRSGNNAGMHGQPSSVTTNPVSDEERNY